MRLPHTAALVVLLLGAAQAQNDPPLPRPKPGTIGIEDVLLGKTGTAQDLSRQAAAATRRAARPERPERPAAPTPPPQPLSPTARLWVRSESRTRDPVRVYLEPSTSSLPAGALLHGTPVHVTHWDRARGWYRVQLGADFFGWVQGKYLRGRPPERRSGSSSSASRSGDVRLVALIRDLWSRNHAVQEEAVRQALQLVHENPRQLLREVRVDDEELSVLQALDGMASRSGDVALGQALVLREFPLGQTSRPAFLSALAEACFSRSAQVQQAAVSKIERLAATRPDTLFIPVLAQGKCLFQRAVDAASRSGTVGAGLVRALQALPPGWQPASDEGFCGFMAAMRDSKSSRDERVGAAAAQAYARVIR